MDPEEDADQSLGDPQNEQDSSYTTGDYEDEEEDATTTAQDEETPLIDFGESGPLYGYSPPGF